MERTWHLAALILGVPWTLLVWALGLWVLGRVRRRGRVRLWMRARAGSWEAHAFRLLMDMPEAERRRLLARAVRVAYAEAQVGARDFEITLATGVE